MQKERVTLLAKQMVSDLQNGRQQCGEVKRDEIEQMGGLLGYFNPTNRNLAKLFYWRGRDEG